MALTLIVGSGRTATHFKHYFQLLKAPFLAWNRQDDSKQSLQALLTQAEQVLLLISDSALDSFIESELKNFTGPILHCSGALEISRAVSMHPLMSFGPALEALPFYESIPFVFTQPDRLQDFFPQLKNASYRINPDEKAKYHALCVLSGNFTTLLWQEAFRGFQKMGLPAEVAHPYCQKIFQNLIQYQSLALTGPLARKDQITVAKNLMSLEDDSLQGIYKVFVQNYFPEYPL